MDNLSRQIGLLLAPEHDEKDPLHQRGDQIADILLNHPDILGFLLLARQFPHGAGQIPEVDRLVVGDEKGFTVDLLMLLKFNGIGMGGEECHGREDVGFRNIADVREIEQIIVIAQLKSRLPLVVSSQHPRYHLYIALAKNTRGPDSQGQHIAILAIRSQDGLLGDPLGFGIVFLLNGAPEHRPAFIRMDEIALGIVDDGRARGVDESLDVAGSTRTFDQVARPFDVDFPVHGMHRRFVDIGHQRGRGGVDDDGRFDLFQNKVHVRDRRDVAVIVLHFRKAIPGRPDVKDGHANVVGIEEVGNDMVSQEPTASDDEDRC